MPASFGEQVAEAPLSPEIVAAGEERARELRLYAARLEVLDGRNLGKTAIQTVGEGFVIPRRRGAFGLAGI
jgi:hypothetical protein